MKTSFSTVFSTLLVVLLAGSLMVSDADATNGYFSHGYGTQSKALAGAGAALPLSTLAAASNPAGMVWLGDRYDISFGLFNPNGEYTIVGDPSLAIGTFGLTPGTVESGSKTFLIPAAGANFMLNEKSSLGISLFGNGGMNTTYDTGTFYGTSPTGVDLMQLFGAVTYAIKFADKHSLGISGIVAFQRFKATGLQAFSRFSSDSTSLTDNGYAKSTGFGARIGYLGKLCPRFSIGGSYQTKMSMSEFDEYSGLFAEQGDFDIPANWTVGISGRVTRKLILVADVQQILYSDVKSVANPMVPAAFYLGTLLGDDEGAGFGWEDMTVFKFGLQYEGIPQLPLRLGYSFGEQPIPESEMMFNILAPGVIEQHITFGFSRQMCKGRELSFVVTRALSKSVSGPNAMELPDQQEIGLKMNQWEFEIGFSF